MKLPDILTIVSFLPFAVVAQTEKMETDRPTESLAPITVLKQHFQVEAGFRREHDNSEGQSQDIYLYPSALLRYGWTKKVELQALIEHEVLYEYQPRREKSASGIEPIKLGFKYNFLEGKKLLPKTAVIARFTIPKWASPDFKSDFVAPFFRLAFENSITDKLKIEYNVGEEWKEDDVHGRFFYSFSPHFEFSDKFIVFAETFAYLSKERPANYCVDVGLLYQFTPNLQVDSFTGVGLSKISPDNFVDLGFSFRLPH